MKRDKSRVIWVYRPNRTFGRYLGLVPDAECPRYYIDSWNPSNPDEHFALFVPESDEVYRMGSVSDCMNATRVHRKKYLQLLGSK